MAGDRENLCALIDQVHAQLSWNFELTLQWKQMENQFKSMNEFLVQQSQEFDILEKEIEERTKVLDQRNKEVETKSKKNGEFQAEFQHKEKQLDVIKKLTADCTSKLTEKEHELKMVLKQADDCKNEINSNKEQLGAVQEMIEECGGQMDSKDRELALVQRTLEECSKELSVKEEQLRLMQKSLQECYKEVEYKKEEVEKARTLIVDCNNKLECKEKELEALQQSIMNCSGKLDLKEKELARVQMSIGERLKELDLINEELEAKQRLMEEHLIEIGVEENRLTEIQKAIKERRNDLHLAHEHIDSINMLIEENTEELNIKEKEYDVLKKSVDAFSMDFKSKRKDLESIEGAIQEQLTKLHWVEVKLKHRKRHIEELELEDEMLKEKLHDLQTRIEWRNEELECKEKELKSFQTLIAECSNQLKALKEEGSEELKCEEKELKFQTWIEECMNKLEAMKDDKGYDALKRSVGGFSMQIKSKKKELESIEDSIQEQLTNLHWVEVKIKRRKRRVEELGLEDEMLKEKLHALQMRIEKRNEELKCKEKELKSFQTSIEECSNQLKVTKEDRNSVKNSALGRSDGQEIKEMRYEERLKELESKIKQFHSKQKELEERWKEIELKEKQIVNNGDLMSKSLQCCIAGNGRNLQLLLTEQLMKHYLAQDEICSVIEKSPDPAKLVLDAMQGFYPSGVQNEDMEFDFDTIRKSCIILLQHLLKNSPPIKPEVQEEAMKLATEWKSKIRVVPGVSLELLGFMQLLHTFKLTSAFSEDELQSLAHPGDKQAPEFWRTLGFGDNFPGRKTHPLHEQMEQMEHSQEQVSRTIHSSSESILRSRDTTTERSSRLAPEGGIDALTQREISAVLQSSSDPAKLVLDVMSAAYSYHMNNSTNINESLMGGTVHIMAQLLKVSPTISPQVKEAARELAVFWQGNMKLESENAMEVLAFLLFSAIYGNMHHLSRETIIEFIAAIALLKETPDICRSLGFTNLIPDSIVYLIERKWFLEAATLSSAFGLLDRFSPELLLGKYLENARMNTMISNHSEEVQNKAVDEELAALKSTLECVTNHNLERRFPIQGSHHRILELEKWKAEGISSAFHVPVIQQQAGVDRLVHQTDPLRHQPLPAPVVQLHPSHQHKRPRVDGARDRCPPKNLLV